jgi:Ca-activated chloride channel homolog
MRQSRWMVPLLTVAAALLPLVVQAQMAVIVPRPAPGVRGQPLEIASCKVEIDVANQVAQVDADFVFHNDQPTRIEGTFLFPLPEATAIHDFAMFVDGKRMEGELLKKEQAREIYDRIVNRQRDPALLEYVGCDLFQANIFPIPADGDTRVQLKYEQLLKRDSGLTPVVFPLRTGRADMAPIKDLVVDVKLRSDVPLKSIYSPTHDIDTTRKSDNEARVGFEGQRVQPDRDFILYYATSDQEFGCNLIAHRERGEDGFFLVLLAPKTKFSEEEIPAKDIVFVFDTSGSMAGDKIDQARKALTFCVDNLGKDDRFNVITFATTVRTLEESLVSATDDHVEEAIEFAKKMKAVGGTNIEEAMASALSMLEDSSRPKMVLFLTDGYPTVGETGVDKLVRGISDANDEGKRKAARVFTFGVGDEVNAALLDRLTRDNGGAPEYVRPKEDIELKVSSLYAKISHPVLTDIEMKIDGVDTYDVFPAKLGDLFCGTELRILGRYDGEGDGKVVVTGGSAKGEQRFTYDVGLPRREEGYGFIPRLWAIRKVGYLLDEIRRKGENRELKDEVVELAMEYGIVTPYTSFLVQEDRPVIAERPVEMRRGFLEAQHAHDTFGGGMMGPGGAAGEGGAYGFGYGGLAGGAFRGTQARGEGAPGMVGAMGPPGPPASPPVDFSLGAAYLDENTGDRAVVGSQGIRGMQVNDSELTLNQRNVQNIGRATFYYDTATQTWVDSRQDPAAKTVDVQRDSEAFQQIILARPDLARYFAQGPRVVVRLPNANLRVGDTGLTSLSPAGLAGLLQ